MRYDLEQGKAAHYQQDFSYVSELLAQKIRRNKLITGVKIPGREKIKCMLYMSNITVIGQDKLSNDRVLKHAMDYDEAAGAKINKKKSMLMVTRNWEGLEDWFAATNRQKEDPRCTDGHERKR